MEFQNRVLTESGIALIAQATSANKIVFVGALSSTAYKDINALSTITPGDLTGPTGTIKTSSATGNVARIVAEYTNQQQAVNVKTVAILARLSTQTDADAVVFAAQSDQSASIYIPSMSELSTSVQVAFNVTIGNASTVAVNSAANVSLGDFERLLERTVTTHANGDADEGEDQTIAGSKTFGGNVTCESDFTASGYAFFESSVQFDTDISVGGDVYANGAVECSHVFETNPTILSDGVGGMYFLTFEVYNSSSSGAAAFHVNRGTAIYQGMTQGTNTINWIQADDTIDSVTSHKYRILKSVSAQINPGTGSNLQVWAIRSV